MKKFKILTAGFLALNLLLGCEKKENNPKEYFSFTANGVDYHYPQVKGTSFVGKWQTLGAGKVSGNLGYMIRGYSVKDETAPGRIEFLLFEDGLPNQDTVILDGNMADAKLMDFLTQGNRYFTNSLYNGHIIFHERSDNLLKGEFEFKAQQQYDSTIIHITNGKFSIIPSP